MLASGMTDSAHRLRLAREAAGFESAVRAAERFGWKYPTYAGHENGSRGLRADALRSYAKAFKVDPAWLLTGIGTPPVAGTPFQSSHNREPVAGFGESEAAPFRVRPESQLSRLLESARPPSGPAMTYEAQRDYAHLGILKGDLLVLGAPETAAPGGVCVVTLVDTTTATGFTAIRQIMDGKVVPLPFEWQSQGDALDIGILGAVAAVIRAPQLRRD